MRDARPALLLCGLVSLLIAIGVRGDAGSEVLSLCRFVPDLDPGFARHLVFDDDRNFHAYCEQAGPAAVRDAYQALNYKLWHCTPEAYQETFRTVGPGLERACRETAALTGCGECATDLRMRRALGSEGFALNRLMARIWRLSADLTTPLDRKAAEYREVIAGFDRMHYEIGALYAERDLARIVGVQGDPEQQMALLRSALARARRIDAGEMECQLLGEIGYEHDSVDSMLACYLEGIAVADRRRMPEQAVRLRLFVASQYLVEDKLAAAMRFAREAEATCRLFGTQTAELRVVFWTMDFFSRLGCWDIVRLYSYRLPVLLRSLEHSPRHEDFEVYSFKVRDWDARLLAAEGRPAEAASLMSELAEQLRRAPRLGNYAYLQRERALALIAAGRPQEALAVAGEGIVNADSLGLDAIGIRLALVRIRAALALSDLGLAHRALRDARTRLGSSSYSFERCDLDALDARASFTADRDGDARKGLERGLLSMRAAVRDLDVGPHAYLALARAGELRDVAQRLPVNEAASSYGFELDWRSMAGRIGRDSVLLSHASARQLPALNPARRPSIHVVYGFIDGRLTRWTRSPAGIRREALAAGRAQCDRQVESLMRLLARDPGSPEAPLSDSLREACSELGRLLLPRELRDGRPTQLVVSAEGSVARLPFEVLDIGSGTAYLPLLARHDVLYARPVPSVRRRVATAASIILLEGNGASGAGGEGVSLQAADIEAARARTHLPDARIVRSGEISKSALLEAWSRSAIVYVAAHLARDREAPLLCFFPMKFGARQDHPEDGYLDFRDLCTVDLSGCKLVVLSSCASGEPYVVGDLAGPSMADAALDAGAAAVIHTRWPVRDERAAVVAPELTGAWLGGADDPAAAFCALRRSMLKGARGWRHPFDWASWSITVRLTTAPWVAVDDSLMAGRAPSTASAHAPPGVSRGRLGLRR